MITIYRVKTGKPLNVAYIIDAKESVENGSYTFTPPTPKVEKPAPVVPKVVKPVPVPVVPKVERPIPTKVKEPLIKKTNKPKNILKKKKMN